MLKAKIATLAREPTFTLAMMITDEYMQQMLTTAKEFTVVILKAGPRRDRPDLKQIVWEHGRRNFSLRAEGKLAIVCPVLGQNEVRGIGIFTTGVDATKALMDDDPGVKEGAFVCEVYPVRSFPGDSLPK